MRVPAFACWREVLGRVYPKLAKICWAKPEQSQPFVRLVPPQTYGFPRNFSRTAGPRRALRQKKEVFSSLHMYRCTPYYSMASPTFPPWENFPPANGLPLFQPLLRAGDTARRQIHGHRRIPHKPSQNPHPLKYNRGFPSAGFRRFSDLCLFLRAREARNLHRR